MKKVQQSLLPIKLEESNEKLTSLGGLLVLEEFLRAKGLWAKIGATFAAPGSGRGYEAAEYVRTLVWLTHAGGRRLTDVRELAAEQEVLAEFGLARLPSPDAIASWLGRQGKADGVKRIAELTKALLRPYLKGLGAELTVDVDATIIEADKREAEWTYKKVKGYQPLLAYVGEVCVHHEFRAGSAPAGSGAMAFIRNTEKRLPGGQAIYWRSDSAFYQAEVINHCNTGGRTFSITADKDCAVKAVIAQIPAGEWQPLKNREGLATGRELAETVHCMEETKEAFRLIVQRWDNPQRDLFEDSPYCYHAVATNREGSAPEVIWEHNQRGTSENWHKELKLGYGMEQLPCGGLEANAMYFAVGVLAYNLGVLMKAELLPAEYRHSTVQTLRWKLYRLAGKLVRHGRQWVLKVRAGSEKLALLLAVRKKCAELS